MQAARREERVFKGLGERRPGCIPGSWVLLQTPCDDGGEWLRDVWREVPKRRGRPRDVRDEDGCRRSIERQASAQHTERDNA